MFVFTQALHALLIRPDAREKRHFKLRLRNEWIKTARGANFTQFF